MPRISREESEPEVFPRWPIISIIVLAVIVRALGIGYGLPYSFHEEEERTVRQAYRLATQSRTPAEFDRPVAMSYIVAAEYGALYGAAHAFGRVGGLPEFRAFYLKNPSAFILLARFTSLGFGILSIYILYLLCRQFFGWGVAVMAAVFLALSPHHVHFSRLGGGEMAALAFSLAGLYWLLTLALEKRLGDAFRSALFFGLAAAAAYHYAVFFLLAAAGYMLVVPREYKKTAMLAGIPFLAFAFAAGLVLPNGMLLFSAAEAGRGFLATVAGELAPGAIFAREGAAATLEELVRRDAFGMALGWIFVSAGLLGLLWGLLRARWKRTMFLIMLTALLLPAAAFFPADAQHFNRWAFPMAAPLAAGAAYILYRLFWRKGMPAAAGITLMALFTTAVAAQGIAETAVSTLRRTGDDTRYRMARHAQGDVPHLARVLATPNARFFFNAADLMGGDAWSQWRADILERWNGRAYRLTVVGLPAPDATLPDLAEYDFVAVDGWTLARLEALDSPEAASMLALIRAARENAASVFAIERPLPGLGGFGPPIELITLEKAPPSGENTRRPAGA